MLVASLLRAMGAVMFVQRSDSALRLNVHFHTLALDGVYVREPSGALAFRALDDVSRVLRERGWARAPPRAELPALMDGQLRLEFG